ncbi:MAG: Threonine synthase, partial [uncultured Solirubrobacteraceae bacterium]
EWPDRALSRPAPVRSRRPRRVAQRGLDAARRRRAPVRARRSRGVAEDRGRQSDRLVQGPRDDLRGVGGGPRGRRGGHLRVDGQHRRQRRRLRRPRRSDRRGHRAGGQDRGRQARPGADARRPRDRAARQLRPGAPPGARAGQAPAHRAGQLGQRIPPGGAEDRRLRAARGARRPRCALHPGRQRGEHHRLLEGLRGERRQAADARHAGIGRSSAGSRRARRAPRDGGQRDPHRQSGALGGGDRRHAGVPRVHPRGLRRGDRRRLPLPGRQRGRLLRAGLGGQRRRSAQIRPRRGDQGRMRADRARPEGPADGAVDGGLGGAVRARHRRGRARRDGL